MKPKECDPEKNNKNWIACVYTISSKLGIFDRVQS